MNKARYQDFIDALYTGSSYGVFIDDTGSPGLKRNQSSLHPDRKTWVGVVVRPDQMSEVLDQFPKAIEELVKQIGAREFHFADIYGRKGDFKNSNLQIRLSIFEFMAEIFSIYNFPIFVQTFDPMTLKEIRSKGKFPNKILSFNLKKQEDAALFFLLIRLKLYIENNRFNKKTLAHVFIDEGYKRNGVAIHIPPWETVFANGLLCFGSSSSILPIQLADFAAFSLNRTQLLLDKEKLTSLDKRLLEILTPIAWNYQNIETRVLRFSDDDFENIGEKKDE